MVMPVRAPSRRRWPWLAGAAVLVLAAVVAWLVAAGRGGDNPPAAGGGPTTTPTTAPSTAAGPGGTSTTAAGGEAALGWTRLNGVRLPVSPTHGPRQSAGGLARGFAHDELGAVLAAANLSYRVSALPGPSVYRPTITQQTTGASAATLADVEANYNQRSASEGKPPGAPLDPSGAQVLGYRLAGGDATGDRVVVRLCGQGPTATGTTAYYTQDHTLEWRDGDWRLRLPLPAAQVVAAVDDCTMLPGA
jgi:hypothetical protein